MKKPGGSPDCYHSLYGSLAAHAEVCHEVFKALDMCRLPRDLIQESLNYIEFSASSDAMTLWHRIKIFFQKHENLEPTF